jgi:hypothetical protein
MLAPYMKAINSDCRPYGYVFLEGNEIVIRGGGPFGAKLMMAIASGWGNIHAEERGGPGNSSWSIQLLGKEQRGSGREIVALRNDVWKPQP